MTKTTYASAGVNIETGDRASKNAYKYAKQTFPGREGKIGEAVIGDGGFAGMVNMGDFYLSQCCDTVGTKIAVAEKTRNFKGLGSDLLCMVADDAVCSGSEVISITNTFETNTIDEAAIDQAMASLSTICRDQNIIISGGEIAEVGALTNGMSWGADAVGIVKPAKVITGKDIKAGQSIIGLKGRVLRCNGLSLARKICADNFGPGWHKESFDSKSTWGEILLTPSKVFHRTLLDGVLGDFESERLYPVHGIVHITGGGIPGNLPRIFGDGQLGATLDNLHAPHEAIKKLVELGNVEEAEAYRAWHCGTAMMLIVDAENADAICGALNHIDPECEAKMVGKIDNSGIINVHSEFSDTILTF